MKILFVLIPATVMLLAVDKINAQVLIQEENMQVTEQTGNYHGMHQKMANSVVYNTDPVNTLRKDYPLVYKTLVLQFKRINKARYTEEGNLLFISFTNEGKQTSAVYYKTGKMKYSVTNLAADLPLAKAAMIKAAYPAHHIFYGKEIVLNNETVFQVIIENKYEYRVINITEDDMAEIQQVKKVSIN